MSCSLFGVDNTEPSYNINTAWRSWTTSFHVSNKVIECDYIYGYTNYYELVKIDARNGEVIWRSINRLYMPVDCDPIIIGNHIYVLSIDFGYAYIYSINKEDGNITAIINTNVNNDSSFWLREAVGVGNYIFFSTGSLCRLDVRNINHDYSYTVRTPEFLEYEIVWSPTELNHGLQRDFFVNNGIVYAHSYSLDDNAGCEIVGYDSETLKQVFYKKVSYDSGTSKNAFVVQDNILCVMLGRSITGFDLNTGEEIYRKVFPVGTGTNNFWSTGGYTQGIVVYNGKAYFCDSGSHIEDSEPDNIRCVDIKTGQGVWSAAPPVSESLGTKPVIYKDKLYITHGYGLRVYNADTGKLLGVDNRYEFSSSGNDILYNNYLITSLLDKKDNNKWPIVAINLGE
jgi:outer membrane protein assembly factor BamB